MGRQKSGESTTEDALDRPQQFFVLSVDTLYGQPIDQSSMKGWREKPPLVAEGKRSKEKLEELIRKGVPQPLRNAVWLSSILRTAHPEQDVKISDEYATLAKVQALEHGWSLVMKNVFPDYQPNHHRDHHHNKENNHNHHNDDDDDDDDFFMEGLMPDFGLGRDTLESILHGDDKRDWTQRPATKSGRHSMTRVLCSIQHMFQIQYCPLLPDVTALLLNCMPESYAYVALRELVSDGFRFLPTTVVEHYTWCRTFATVLRKMYPETARAMEEIGASTPEGLKPIFERFFVPIFKKEHLLRLLDIYMIEGNKALFRFGIVLIGMVKKPLKAMNISTTDQWWENVKDLTHNPTFDMNELIRRAYGNIGGKYRKSFRFPRRRVLNRLNKLNERWAMDHAPELATLAEEPPPRPLGLIRSKSSSEEEEEEVEVSVKCILAKDATVRLHLASWLPPSLRGTKLDLIYSTNVHGRTLAQFYKYVSKAKRTFVLCQVADTGAVIGMFATSAWHATSKVYGDGGCFLFRASPQPECYKWSPGGKQHQHQHQHDSSFDEDLEEAALKERFMASRHDFISMGGNERGTCGLRLNEDLSRGSSDVAMGFENEPLAGGGLVDFEVGVVEVYRLMREIDGMPIDKVDDIWNF